MKTNGHTTQGQLIDSGVEADREFAETSSPYIKEVAKFLLSKQAAKKKAVEARQLSDSSWIEFAEIETNIAAGREALALSEARGKLKPLAAVLARFKGRGTPAEDLDTARRTCEIRSDDATELELLVVDEDERWAKAEKDLQHDTWERYRAVTSRRFEAMRVLVDGCGPTHSPGSDLQNLILPNSENWIAWTQANVYISPASRETALTKLNAILSEEPTT